MYDILMQETNNPNYSDETVTNEKCVAEEETEEELLEESDDGKLQQATLKLMGQ